MPLRLSLGLRAALVLVLFIAAGGAQAHQALGRDQAADRPKAPASPELVAQGRGHFQHYCRSCHAPPDGSRRTAPDLTGLYGRGLTPAMKQPVTDANISGHIKQGGPRMPPFPWLGTREIDALLAYLKTL